jgi:putative transposase
MDSKGWALDNIFVERLWRSVKYEEVYLKDYRIMRDACLKFYNKEMPHQALQYNVLKSRYHVA